jgi:hypothetical protein
VVGAEDTLNISLYSDTQNISLDESKDDQNILPLKANKAIYSTPAEKLNSFDLRSVSPMTAVDPCLSPETNNVIYPASSIWRPNSKNIINKLSESKNNTMEPASKNVINDMSKSAVVNNTKLVIRSDIVDTNCERISDFCTIPNMGKTNKEYVLDNIKKPIIYKLFVETGKKVNTDSAAAQAPVMNQSQVSSTPSVDQVQFSSNIANMDIKDILNNSLPQKEVILREAIPKYSMRAIIPLTFA